MSGQAKHRDKRRAHNRERFAVAGVLVLLAGVLVFAFSQVGEAAFPVYRSFSKAVQGVLARATSIVPFAVWDIALTVLVVGFFVALVVCVFRRRGFVRWLSTLLVAAAAIALLGVGTWALNHYAPPLSDALGIEVTEYSEDQLAEATRAYLLLAAADAQAVERQDDGVLEHQDFYELAQVAGSSYETLGEQFPIFEGSTAPVKALLIGGDPLLYTGHNGVFCPVTGEATVPLNCSDEDLPLTMAHEVAHRLGIASEQEVNFAAYLACAASDDVRFRYAGNLRAFCWCYSALAQHDPDRAKALVEELIGDVADSSDVQAYGVRLVISDWQNSRKHYRAFEGPLDEVGTATNDTYLKLFGEKSGVRSYGEVVDYLIALNERAS